MSSLQYAKELINEEGKIVVLTLALISVQYTTYLSLYSLILYQTSTMLLYKSKKQNKRKTATSKKHRTNEIPKRPTPHDGRSRVFNISWNPEVVQIGIGIGIEVWAGFRQGLFSAHF